MKKLLFTFVLLFSLNSFGQSNYSLEFDGVDDKLDLGYLNTFDPSGHVTIEAWVKPYSTPPDSNNSLLFLVWEEMVI